MSQEWAALLLSLAYHSDFPLSYDRLSGEVDYTLADLESQAPGTTHETFHFVLNNQVVKVNRIPPYGMRYDIARERNALPVPATQYGNPGPGGAVRIFDSSGEHYGDFWVDESGYFDFSKRGLKTPEDTILFLRTKVLNLNY